jgi:hypothetical protein
MAQLNAAYFSLRSVVSPMYVKQLTEEIFLHIQQITSMKMCKLLSFSSFAKLVIVGIPSCIQLLLYESVVFVFFLFVSSSLILSFVQPMSSFPDVLLFHVLGLLYSHCRRSLPWTPQPLQHYAGDP